MHMSLSIYAYVLKAFMHMSLKDICINRDICIFKDICINRTFDMHKEQ
jgi:hypothetical protein